MSFFFFFDFIENPHFMLFFKLLIFLLFTIFLTFYFIFEYSLLTGFPCGSVGKESSCNAGDLGLISGLGRFPWKRGKANYSSILALKIPWTV